MEILEARIAPATLLFASQLANYNQAAQNLVTTDGQGNIIVVGLFDAPLDADLGPGVINLTTSDAANGDVYIAKYQPDGTAVWQQKWGGTGAEQPFAVVADPNGDIFVTGNFDSSNAGFGGSGTLSSTGSTDVFVLKLSGVDGSAVTAFDTDGQMKFGGTDGDSAKGMDVDGNGNLLVAGSFSSSNAGFNGTGLFGSGGPQSGFVFRVSATSGAPDATFGPNGGLIGPGILPNLSDARYVFADANNDVFLGVVAFGDSTHNVLKFNGTDGAPSASFTTISLTSADVFDTDFALAIDRNSGRVVVATDAVVEGNLIVRAFDGITGSPDLSFAFSTGGFTVALATTSLRLLIDSGSNIYAGGLGDGGAVHYFLRIDKSGTVATSQTFGKPNVDAALDLGMAIDPADNVILRGSYLAGADIAPGGETVKLKPRGGLLATPNMIEGFVLKIDPFGIDRNNPLFFEDANGEEITVSIDGPGRASYRLEGGGSDVGDLDTLELIDTDLTTKVTIAHSSTPTFDTTVNRIFTAGANQHVGSITLAPFVLLGDLVDDAIPDLRVTGKLNSLQIDGINDFAYIKLGEGLPYDVPGEDKTPDTYNNKPNVDVGFVLGPGVVIEVIGDGVTAGGPGGGGLGKVTFGGWGSPGGVIRTTQSIGDFTVKTGDFLGRLEVDKDHLGAGTQANVGNMSIPNGAWGGSGTEIEGAVKAFDAQAFLENATITAASIGKIKTTTGAFDGTLILTDPDSPGVPTFIVTTDFTGTVISASTIKKLLVKGDFTGSLTAPSIGAITAYAFLGTAGVTSINATEGALGLITATAGVVKDYEIVTDLAFSGFKINLGKLVNDTVGIDNVKITAASIGNISVKLSAAATATGINLIGIRDSEFVTTGTGTTKGTIGRLGNVSVTLKGAATGASATGIVNSTFDARVLAEEFGTGSPASTVNALGKVTVQISGSGGNSVGLQNAAFEGDTIGSVKVSVARLATGTGHGVEGASFTATNAIDALSFDGDASEAQVQGLEVWSGGTVGAVSVKSKTASNGTLADSAILTGQSLDMTGTADPVKLAAATLGSVKVTGSITNTQLVAGGSIGAVAVGLDLTDSLLLAGAKFGGDFALDGDETYQRSAAIAAVTVKGAFARTSIVAGINPGNGIFGDMDDAAAVNLAGTSSIGAIGLSAGSLTGVTGSQVFAIEAGTIKTLKLGATIVPTITTPQLLDLGSAGVDADDLIVRLI